MHTILWSYTIGMNFRALSVFSFLQLSYVHLFPYIPKNSYLKGYAERMAQCFNLRAKAVCTTSFKIKDVILCEHVIHILLFHGKQPLPLLWIGVLLTPWMVLTSPQHLQPLCNLLHRWSILPTHVQASHHEVRDLFERFNFHLIPHLAVQKLLVLA